MPRVFRGPAVAAAIVAATAAALWLAAMRPIHGQAAYPELLPVDEASLRPEFFTFRAHLQAAIARRDWPALLAVVHPRIRNSFGPDDGIETFREEWQAGRPESRVWEVLGAVLALGGSFDQAGNFMAPYVYSRWPSELDSFEHVAVIGSRVRVRSAPRADADVIAALSYAILPRPPRADESIPAADRDQWTAVTLAGGRAGFIASAYVRSPGDYRAIFAEEGGRWRMMAFIAGD